MEKGYTLLEVLVVLTLLGLLVGLVTPRLDTVYRAVQAAYQEDDVIAVVAGLGRLARTQGQSFSLHRYPPQEGDEEPPFTLPDGWRISTDTPITYRFNGVCTGGTLTLHGPVADKELSLQPPFCQPGS